jgi:phosphoenolpyruvate carboxykinase (ATP)
MLGESISSSAADDEPDKPRRVVGTNPFIIGPLDEEGNRFYELTRKNKHLDCYLLNTGMVGKGLNSAGEKITVHDSAIMIREIARGTVKWKKDPDWGYEIPEEIPGIEMARFEFERYYSDDEYAKMAQELRTERTEWLSQFKELYPCIRNSF